MTRHAARCAVLVLGSVAFVTVASMPPNVAAQSYPERKIRLVVPFPAGGTTDLYARAISPKLDEQLGQRVTVDNRPGAGGRIGGEFVARATPDGYTLIVGTTSTFGIGPNLHSNSSYDPVKDFVPVILASQAQNMLLVHPSVQARQVSELVNLARAHPGKLNFASAGLGSSSHVAGELFKSMTRTDMTHIPYKGTSLAMVDLLSGNIALIFDSLATALPSARSGKLRALAVTGTHRTELMPHVPTVAEAGVPGYEVSAWLGILAPAQTPRAVIMHLNAALNTTLQMADIRKTWADQGADVKGGTPEAFASHVRSELEKWGKLIRDANIRLD